MNNLLAQQGWSTEWITFIAFVGSLVGGAIVWFATKGIDAIIRWRQFRLDEKEREAKQRAAIIKPFSTEQMWEDKTLAMGYKALLYHQDKRIRDLEDRDIQRTKDMQALHTSYLNCVAEHAEASAKYEQCRKELDEERKKRHTELEDERRKRQKLERKLQQLSERTHTKIDDDKEDENDRTQPGV